MTVCLNMIVKDEANVIERCLASVKPFIDHWVIVDTGSTDGTQDLIRRFIADIPGQLHERRWRDFGHNRTEALNLAHGKSDYVLFMDADNIFHVPEGWSWPSLSGQAYYIDLVSGGTRYRQNLLISNVLPWRWVGVLHEYLTSDSPHQIEALVGPWIDRRHEGARSRDPDTFRKDAVILEQALKKEPENLRYAFYLAQSLRDAKEPQRARQAYLHRAQMGGWDEEVWYSLYQVGLLTEQLQGSGQDVRESYLAAYQFRPTRVEPLVALARWHNRQQQWALGQLYAHAAMRIEMPPDILFMDEGMYRWGAIDEAAVAAYWLGDHNESVDLCMHLLDNDLLPETERLRVETNRDFSAPSVAARTTQYPTAIVQRLIALQQAWHVASSPEDANVTLTVTTCKRFDLFERTMNSFLNCCQDVHRIRHFVCVDDNSNEEDRQRMQALYPFFVFILKGPKEKGHSRSMNRLREVVNTPYWLHMEDDWEFLVRTDYVGRAIDILQTEAQVAQVLFNRNYAETLSDRSLVGGFVRKHPLSGRRYVLHEYVPSESHVEFFQRHPRGALSNMWWPHFSLRPSMMDAHKVLSLGPFEESSGHFEKAFAQRFMAQGHLSAFFDLLVCQHIGRLTSERGSSKFNAYELNDEEQF